MKTFLAAGAFALLMCATAAACYPQSSDSGSDTADGGGAGNGGPGGNGGEGGASTDGAALQSDNWNGVTFYKDVQPILQTNCQGCHVAGGIAPMPLVTYSDAQVFADSIKSETGSKLMPPWGRDFRRFLRAALRLEERSESHRRADLDARGMVRSRAHIRVNLRMETTHRRPHRSD